MYCLMMVLRIQKILKSINNIPGVLENGLFVDLTDKVLVGKIENNVPVVILLQKLTNFQI